ncbi:MAG: OmpA family protein [Verrucomicrobiales bacterium]
MSTTSWLDKARPWFLPIFLICMLIVLYLVGQEEPEPAARTGGSGLTEDSTATPESEPTPEPPSLAPPAEPNPTQASPTQVEPSQATPTVETRPVVDRTAADIEESRLVRAEVLKRIDIMPDLSPTEQDKLYIQVERAELLECVARLPFGVGGSRPSAAQAAELCVAMKEAHASRLRDPTTVVVVLGYADRTGDETVNRRVSLARADSVREVLRDQCGILNVTHSIGMGSSDMFDAENLEKNRLVEVWLVVP